MRRISVFFVVLIMLCWGSVKGQDTARVADVRAEEVLAEAVRHLGKPYHYGSRGPNSFDCSGFTRYVFGQFGVSLSASAGGQYGQGTTVEKKELRPGDLVFFNGRKRNGRVGHVGLVTEVDTAAGTFRFIHACSRGVRVSPSTESYYIIRYVGARRVLREEEPEVRVVLDEVDTAMVELVEEVVEVDTFRVRVAMVGDMMLGTTYPKKQLPKNGGKNLFDDVGEILREADLAVGNFEGAMCENGKCTKGKGKYSYAFRMPPSYIEHFKNAGFDFVSLANNHYNDFGRQGLQETMDLLDSVEIGYAGVRGFCRKAVREIGGVRYGYCAFGHNDWTYCHQDTATVKAIVRELRDTADLVIVSFHGGGEGKDKIHLPEGKEVFLGEDRGTLREFAHLCIDEGADLVYGHGPHVCRAMELYKGHLIAYSLGNFCTPAGILVTDISGYAPVVEAVVNRKGELVEGKVHSFRQVYGKGPKKDDEDVVAKFIKKLSYEDIKDNALEIDDDGAFRPKGEE